MVERQPCTVFHLSPILTYENRTGLHNVLTLKKKLRAFLRPQVRASSQLKDKSCVKPYAYTINYSAICERQLLRKFPNVLGSCQTSVVRSEEYP